MQFSYKGINASGKNEKGRIEAQSEEEALAKLQDLNVYVSAIKEVSGESFAFDFKEFFHQRYNKISNSYLSALSKELSVYLKSGISLMQAIGLLKEQQDSAKYTRFLTRIHKMLLEGETLSRALRNQAVFSMPDFYVKTIEASESTGNLDKVLEQLSDLLKKNDQIESEVQNALIYPLFIFIMSFFVVLFLINYVIPKIAEIFEQMQQELPLSTQIVIATGHFMQNYGIYILLALFVLFFIFIIAVRTNETLQKKVDLFMLKIPMMGKMIFVSEIARFSVITANLLKAGIPLVQSILLSSQTFKNTAIIDEFKDANKKIVEGTSLSKALSNCKNIEMPKSFIHSINVGENSGNLPDMMLNISELYMFDMKNRQDKFIAILEPAVILFMGIVVGFIVVSMLLPIFNMNFQ